MRANFGVNHAGKLCWFLVSQVFGLGSFGVVVRARLSFVFSVVVLVYSYQGGNKNITSCSKTDLPTQDFLFAFCSFGAL